MIETVEMVLLLVPVLVCHTIVLSVCLWALLEQTPSYFRHSNSKQHAQGQAREMYVHGILVYLNLSTHLHICNTCRYICTYVYI